MSVGATQKPKADREPRPKPRPAPPPAREAVEVPAYLQNRLGDAVESVRAEAHPAVDASASGCEVPRTGAWNGPWAECHGSPEAAPDALLSGYRAMSAGRTPAWLEANPSTAPRSGPVQAKPATTIGTESTAVSPSAPTTAQGADPAVAPAELQASSPERRATGEAPKATPAPAGPPQASTEFSEARPKTHGSATPEQGTAAGATAPALIADAAPIAEIGAAAGVEEAAAPGPMEKAEETGDAKGSAEAKETAEEPALDEAGGSLSGGGGASGGGGGSMAALRSQVQAQAQAIPQPAISTGGGGVVGHARQREEEIHFIEPAVAESARAQMPETPQEMPVPPEPTAENPVPTATQRVEETAGRTLPEQSFAALVRTPLENTPRLGARPLPPERIREAHHVLDDGNLMSMEDDPRQPLLDLREQMLNPPEVAEQQSGAATLAPHPPQPVPTPTPNARTQMAQVFARLLARPENEARQMLSQARRAAFPGGTLQAELPDYGNDPHLADLSRELTTQYRDIATQAGVSADELDQAIADRQQVLQEEELAAREDLVSSTADATTLVCEAHDDLASTIATEAERNRATADAVAANGGGGSYADQVHARRDGLIRTVTRRAAEIDAAYRRAKEDRDRELDTAQSQRVDAYRAAAQMDDFQLNEMAWLPPERQTRLREIYTSRTGQSPSQETGLSQIEINTLAAASTRWADDRAVEVRNEVRAYKETVGADTGRWRAATLEAAEDARTDIRAWDEAESGETRSWWDEFWDWVNDWVDQAHANADAWQAQQNQQHAAEVVTDLNLIDRLSRAADRGITEEQRRELESLTGDQRRIVQEFFQARSEGRSVDPISLVADLTRARIWNERRQNLIQRLEETFLEDTSLEYATIDRVVGLAVSGLTSKLYAAFHGNWGWLSEAGTDEEAVYAALDGLNRVQSLALRNIYRRRYGVELESELRSEMSGGELDRAQALLSGNRAEAAAATLYSAMHETFLGTGLGTDEAAIHSTLRGLSAEERAEVVRIYKERYGRDLAADTRGELDDWATFSGREADRADAELAGNLELADAIEIEEELQGSWFHSSTTTTVAAVYERVRREVQQQALRENRDSAWMEAEIARRTQGIRHSYDDRNAATGATLSSDIEAATQAEAHFWGNTPENRDASRDYLQALSRNDMASADAARIRIERTALVYADDDVITGTLGSQYERALVAERLDYGPERRRALLAALDEEEHRSGRVWTADERWAARQRVERQLERELSDRARTVASENLSRMEGEYASRYGESARTAILESTSGVDNEMAAAQLDQGGYLDPYQTFDFATRGAGTDEEAAKRAFAGLTAEEIARLDARWRREHGGESLLDRARAEMSGRDLLDMEIALDGAPETIDQQIAQMRRRVEFERPTNPLGASLAVTEREVMEAQLAHMEAMSARMHAPPAGSTPEEQRRARDTLMDEFDTQTSLVQESIEHHRQRTDALVDSITTVVGIVVAVVVGVVGSIFTGGAAGAVALAVIASLASTAATIGTRALLKGNAYGWEDFAVDVGIGLVDAVVAALTAGLGDKLLGAARPAGQAAVRSATATGLRGAWQRAILGLNRSAARLGETGLITNRVRPIGLLQRMASKEASMLSRGAASLMAETAENFVQSLPSTALGVALDDNTWNGPGNPLMNLLSGTAQGLGQGLVMGMAMGPVTRHVQSGFGRVRGLAAGPRLGADTHLRMPERPLPGSPEYRARLDEWQSAHPGRPEAEFQTRLDHDFDASLRAYEAQQAVRRDVATQLQEALPPGDRALAAEVPVTVVSDIEFRRLNNLRPGDATVVVRDGQVHIVVREGAPPHAVRAQLAAQVERLRNLVEPGTGGRVRDPRAALPRDLRGRLAVDIEPDLPPRTVRVEHTPVPRIVAGPGARAADIRLHVETARNVLQLHGAFGRVRHLLDRFADWAFLHGEPPAGTRAWEARQELRKLPDVIEARMREAAHPDLTAHQRAQIEADIAHLHEQVAAHRRTLADLDLNPGRGFIAAEGRAVPPRAELDAAHQRWMDRMRAAIRGEGPPPPPWRGPEPKLDNNASWRGFDPAEAYAAYRVALENGGGKYEAIISRDRLTGEYQVMLGFKGSVAPPAATPGRSWETVMHFHPNQEGALRYTLPAQNDVWQAIASRYTDDHPQGAPHVEFVESVINGQRTRVAIVVDDQGVRLEIGRGAAGAAGPVAKGEVMPLPAKPGDDRILGGYLDWWNSQHAGTPLPRPSDPQGTRWVPEGSQEYRDLMHGSAKTLGHTDVTQRIEADAPEMAGVPAAPRTMAGQTQGPVERARMDDYPRRTVNDSPLRNREGVASVRQVGDTWPDPAGGGPYRHVEAVDRHGRIVDSYGEKLNPDGHWVMRGSDINKVGQVGERASAIEIRQRLGDDLDTRIQRAEEEGRPFLSDQTEYFMVNGQNASGQGFDKVRVEVDPGQIIVENGVPRLRDPNYVPRAVIGEDKLMAQVSLESITATRTNLIENLVDKLFNRAVDWQQGVIAGDLSALGLTGPHAQFQAELLVKALFGRNFHFEITVGPRSDLGDWSRTTASGKAVARTRADLERLILYRLREHIRTSLGGLEVNVTRVVLNDDHLAAASGALLAERRIGQRPQVDELLGTRPGFQPTDEQLHHAWLLSQADASGGLPARLVPATEPGRFIDATGRPVAVMSFGPSVANVRSIMGIGEGVLRQLRPTVRDPATGASRRPLVVLDITHFTPAHIEALAEYMRRFARQSFGSGVFDHIITIDSRTRKTMPLMSLPAAQPVVSKP